MQALRLLWFVPCAVAVQADEWKLTAGVALHAERNPSSEAQFAALASGQVDAVVTAMDNVMDWNLRAGPRDLRIVAQLERTTPLTLVGQKCRAGVEDLRGATILVDAPRNGFVVALRAMLAERGVGAESYELAPIGGVKERFDALMEDHGDATLLGPPFDAMALQAGLSRIASVQERYPDFPGQGLVVRAAAIERLRPALCEWLGGLDVARQRMGNEAASSLRPDRAGVELLIRQRREAGLPGADTSYEQLVDASLLPRP